MLVRSATVWRRATPLGCLSLGQLVSLLPELLLTEHSRPVLPDVLLDNHNKESETDS